MDLTKVRRKWTPGRQSLVGDNVPEQTWVDPYVDAANHFIRLTDTGFERGLFRGPHPPKLFYDIRAIDDTRIRFFLTINGRLSSWLFDGKDWTHTKTYSIHIDGRFLVFDRGRQVVAVKDGQWATLDIAEQDQQRWRPIVGEVRDEPLTLIEDRTARRTLFLHDGSVYDEDGTEQTALDDLESEEKLISIAEFTWSKRGR